MRVCKRGIVLLTFNTYKEDYETALVSCMCISFFAASAGINLSINFALTVFGLMSLIFGFILYCIYRFEYFSDRIFQRSGLFRIVSSNVEFDRIERISIRRSFFERLFGLSTISIYTLGNGRPAADLLYLNKSQQKELLSLLEQKNIHLPTHEQKWHRCRIVDEIKGLFAVPHNVKLGKYAMFCFFSIFVLSGQMSFLNERLDKAKEIKIQHYEENKKSKSEAPLNISILDNAQHIPITIVAVISFSLLLICLLISGRLLYYINEVMFCSWRITDDKIEIRSGLLVRQSESLAIKSINTIKIYRSFFGTANHIELISIDQSMRGVISALPLDQTVKLVEAVGFDFIDVKKRPNISIVHLLYLYILSASVFIAPYALYNLLINHDQVELVENTALFSTLISSSIVFATVFALRFYRSGSEEKNSTVAIRPLSFYQPTVLCRKNRIASTSNYINFVGLNKYVKCAFCIGEARLSIYTNP